MTEERAAGPGLGGLTRLGGLVCLLLLAGYGVLWSGVVQRSGGADHYVRQVDFRATLTAATIVAGPAPERLYDAAWQQTTQTRLTAGEPAGVAWAPYTAPPFAAILLAPLLRGGASAGAAFTLWAVLATVAAGVAIGVLAGRWPAPRSVPWLLMLAATSFLPLIAGVMLGRQDLLALLGWVGLTAGLKSGRPVIAGVVGALAVFQPAALPGLLLLLVVTRQGRALGALAGTLALAGAAVMPALGPGWPLAYGRFLAATTGVDPLVAAAAGAGLLLLLAVWLRPRPRVAWHPGTAAWDLRWALSLLTLLPVTLLLDSSALVLGILPGWILATTVAAGRLPGAAARFWGVWLAAGYLLAPLSVLYAPLPLGVGLVWFAAAWAVLAWALSTGALHEAGTGAANAPPRAGVI